jgi:putative ABC transport system permease protein
MDIVPILQTFRHNKGALLLAIAQISFTLAVLANALVVIDTYRSRLALETGIDPRSTVTVEVEPIDRAYFDEAGRVQNDAQRQIDRLRGLPGVEAVSQVGSFPLSGESPMRASWPQGGEEAKAVRHSVYAGDQAFLDAFGLKLVAGRTFSPEEVNWTSSMNAEDRVAVVLVSKELAEQLFPGENPLGKQIQTEGGRLDTIVGVVDRMPGRHILMNTIRLGAVVPSRPLTSLRYAVRLNGEATPATLEQIATALEATGGEFDIRVDSVQTRMEQSTHYVSLLGTILGGISLLLIAVTAIGAYSSASYSVGKRIRQIGVRRAIGANRLHILRYFLLENWLTTTMGLLLGLLFANGLSFVLTQAMQLPRVSWDLLLVSMAFLWCAGLLSTLIPALRAARVPPAIATRAAS